MRILVEKKNEHSNHSVDKLPSASDGDKKASNMIIQTENMIGLNILSFRCPWKKSWEQLMRIIVQISVWIKHKYYKERCSNIEEKMRQEDVQKE